MIQATYKRVVRGWLSIRFYPVIKFGSDEWVHHSFRLTSGAAQATADAMKEIIEPLVGKPGFKRQIEFVLKDYGYEHQRE